MVNSIKAKFRKLRIYRRLKGGLWIGFQTGERIQTRWTDCDRGYIRHPQGGVFHSSFESITSIEDFGKNNCEECNPQ